MCRIFDKQKKAGRPLNPDRGGWKQLSDGVTTPTDTITSSDFLPSTSTPTKHAHATTSELCTPVKQSTISFVDMATSPFAQDKTLRPLQQLQTPLTRDEEAYFTQISRLKMKSSSDNNTLTCKTGGQPLVFKKVVNPRKTSDLATSLLLKKRARHMLQLRNHVSGTSLADSLRLHSTELKIASKHKRHIILYLRQLEFDTHMSQGNRDCLCGLN